MLLFDFLILILSFLAIWLSAGVAINAVESFAGRFHLSKFALSLFVLGTVTSLPEIAVTINAIALQVPQVAVGNLIGGQMYILFLVVPLLAVLSRGLHLKIQMQGTSLALILLVVLAPMLAFFDQRLNIGEALVILAIYIVFVLNFARSSTVVEDVVRRFTHPEKSPLWWELIKIIGAVIVLLIASNVAVKGIVDLSNALNVPRFLVSLLILPLGTNLPELTLAVKAVVYGKKDVALGNFIGSIAFNSLLLFFLVIAYGSDIVVGQNIAPLIVFFIVGLFTFWFFCRSNTYLSVKEGVVLLLFFAGFVSLAAWLGLDGFF